MFPPLRSFPQVSRELVAFLSGVPQYLSLPPFKQLSQELLIYHFFFGTGVWIQDLTLGRQALYQLSQAHPNPKLVTFLDCLPFKLSLGRAGTLLLIWMWSELEIKLNLAGGPKTTQRWSVQVIAFQNLISKIPLGIASSLTSSFPPLTPSGSPCLDFCAF
jgi:hypothetical protein